MNPRRLLLPGPILVRVVLWVAVFLACPLSGTAARLSFELEVLGCTTFHALPPGSTESLVRTEGVLAYLEKAELKETDPWLRDDIRIAWITTKWAQHGVPASAWVKDSPHAAATFQVLRCRPEEVWPRILQQRQETLGALYTQVWGDVSSPRKPVQSVKLGAASRKNLAS
jgi:hypothetical protein